MPILLFLLWLVFNERITADVIITYFIEHRVYDIMLINEYLFSYDQQLLGA